MAISATVHLECDTCGADVDEDLEQSQSAEDIIDREGWTLTGPLMDWLLCPDCDKEEDETV